MRQFILSCILGATALSAAAVETSVDFSYAGDDLNTWGRFKSEIYDVAIRINDPAFVGKKITSIRALLNADGGLEATSVWLSKELKLDKNEAGVKVNVPDTYSKDVDLEHISMPGVDESMGQLSATLDTPYEITTDGIYVGYSLTVPAAESGQELPEKLKQPIMVAPCTVKESLYIRASKDVLTWANYNSNIQAAAAIYVTLEGDFEEYCLSLNGLSPVNTAINKDYSVRATLLNTGAETVKQIGYSYTIDGTTHDATIDLDIPIATHFVKASTVMLPVGQLTEVGDYMLNVKIKSINGHDNTSARNSASASVKALAYMPTHRPMLEEFTGTWCGWCPRGMLSLEKLNELYGDNVVTAAYHVNDPMQAPSTPVSIGGCPTSTLNRGPLMDPFYAYANPAFGMKDEVLASMETGVPAGIEAEALWADDAHTKISLKTWSTFYEDNKDAGYKVGYILLNNGLKGTDGSWLQSNYYATSASVYIGTELEPLTKLPPKAPIVFDDVVVDTSGMKGVDGSLPREITTGSTYDGVFSIDIADNTVIQDKDQLYVAAFILNPDRTILNAVKVHVGDVNGVELVEAGIKEVSAEYYTLSGIRVQNPENGIFVKVAHLADGSVRTSKIRVNH